MLDMLSRAGAKLATLLNERSDYGINTSSPTLDQLNHFFETYNLSSLLPYRPGNANLSQ